MERKKEILGLEHLDNDDIRRRQYPIWKRVIPKVNIEMLPTKVTYLLWGGLVGSYHVYLMPFFISIGLSVTQAGIITGMISISYSFAGPFWGMITDYTGRRKTILIILVSVSTVTIFSLPWVVATLKNGTMSPGQNITTNSTKNTTDNLPNSINEENLSLFQIYFLLITLGAIFFSVLPGYIDAIASQVVKQSSTNTSYGSQRIFGSIGSFVILYLSGVAVDHVRIPGMSEFSIAFILYVPFALLLVPLGCYLINQIEEGKKKIETKLDNETNNGLIDSEDNRIAEEKQSILLLLAEQFKRVDFLFFLLTAFISGLAFSLFIYFTILLLDNESDLSKSRIAVIFCVASASSVIMFPFTAKIIKWMRGPLPAVSLGIFSYSVRYIIMSYINNYWLIAIIQALNSFGFALLWAAMMDYVHIIAPPRIKVTMILVLQSVHFGIAPFTTNIVGGKIYDLYGGKILFRSYGVVCGLWGTLGFIRFYLKECLLNKNDITEVDLKDKIIEE